MQVISVINQKGGAGKTTLAINLSCAATLNGLNVMVLDLDPQCSITEWHEAREGDLPVVESIQAARLDSWLKKAKEHEADLVVLDTAPHSNDIAVKAVQKSDLVLVPVRPEIADIRAVMKTYDIITQTLPPLAFAVLNHTRPQGTDAEEAKQTLGEIGFSVSPIEVRNRVAFSRAQIEGKAAIETDPGSKAAEETQALWAWLSNVLEINKKEVVNA